MQIEIAKICTAFQSSTIGSKVLNRDSFMQRLIEKIKSYETNIKLGLVDFSIKVDAPGQYCIIMDDAAHLVSAGDGKRSPNPEDYVIRVYREGPKLFLKRKCAGEVNSLKVIVYTRQAYLDDPDITPDEIASLHTQTTHIIIAVLASSGPSPELSPFRFVHNLAGGNNAYLTMSGDEIRAKAKAILEYTNEYMSVAD